MAPLCPQHSPQLARYGRNRETSGGDDEREESARGVPGLEVWLSPGWMTWGEGWVPRGGDPGGSRLLLGSCGEQAGSSLRQPGHEAATSFAFDGTAGITSGVEFFSVLTVFIWPFLVILHNQWEFSITRGTSKKYPLHYYAMASSSKINKSQT